MTYLGVVKTNQDISTDLILNLNKLSYLKSFQFDIIDRSLIITSDIGNTYNMRSWDCSERYNYLENLNVEQLADFCSNLRKEPVTAGSAVKKKNIVKKMKVK
jgi:hypothetical protein